MEPIVSILRILKRLPKSLPLALHLFGVATDVLISKMI